jgi:rhodanese-related sulfurtransferase
MKENRTTIAGLVMILVLLTAGCSLQEPAGATQPAATATGQGIEASSAETEPLTMTTAGGVAEATGPSSFDLPPNLDGFVELSVDQLHEILPGHDFTLVNVHIPYEGELPDTDLFIPFDQITNHQAELPAKDAPIVLYCRSGPMSTQAAKVLVGLGYSQVYELEGGFNAWVAANYELLKKQ